MSGQAYFSKATRDFLRALSVNNNRAWFNEHKPDYERHVREPALRFIADMAEPLAGISTHFRADPRKMGGSLMRVYRDTRYARDKTPYKTNIGIQFRHEQGRDVHAPGFYVHIEADAAFVGAGIWRPESTVVRAIRTAIDENPRAWVAARDNPGFARHYRFGGETLRTAPRGYPRDHPFIDDLRRKDFIAISDLSPASATRADFLDKTVARFEQAREMVRFLCAALDVPF